MKKTIKVSNSGYKNNSPDKNQKSLLIPSNRITMKNVKGPVFGQDNLGNTQMMYPDGEYNFPGDYVIEHPMFQVGGNTNGANIYGIPDESAFDRVGLQKWGKYITDPKRRDQHIKDIYWNMMDDGYGSAGAFRTMRDMGAYGSQDRGESANKAADWGWDSKDITEDKLRKFSEEYDNFKNKKLGGDMKRPDNEGFNFLPERVQNMILNKMQTGGQNDFNPLIYAQNGAEVKTPTQLKTLQAPVKSGNVAQKLATQYNLDNLPSTVERNTWNNYLDWVEQKGYKPDSDSALSLNKGTNRFPELSSEYNTQILNKNKDDYAKAKTRSNFDKNITEDQFVQARSVNPQMMANAQKVYGQQTKKDNWFGSETAQTFYPKIEQLGVNYTDATNPVVQAKMKAATGKLAPVRIYDHRTNQLVPFKGVTKINGYDSNGNPQYDNSIQSYNPTMASNIYYDAASLPSTTNTVYQSFLNPTPPLATEKKYGGNLNLNKFMTNYSKQFGGAQGNQKIQGQSIDEYLQKNNSEFQNYLSNNVQNAMYKDEYMNFQNLPRAQNGLQVNLDNPENPLQPRNQNNFNSPGPFGVYAQQDTPDYVNNQTSQYNMPVEHNYAPSPYQYGNMENGMDPNLASYQRDLQTSDSEYALKMQAENQVKQNHQNRNNNIADFAMAGAQTLNNFFNKAQNYKQQQFINQQNSISNTSPAFYGNRGDYDVNQGKLRPNQTTTAYKKGGQYSLNHKDLTALVNAGYDIEFLD